jgi:hypothetical protein
MRTDLAHGETATRLGANDLQPFPGTDHSRPLGEDRRSASRSGEFDDLIHSYMRIKSPRMRQAAIQALRALSAAEEA